MELVGHALMQIVLCYSQKLQRLPEMRPQVPIVGAARLLRLLDVC